MNNYFSNRITVRKYLDKEIPTEIIHDIVEKAMRAPTCGNMQLYSVIVTSDKKRKEKLSDFHFNQPAATGANVILTICADFNRFSKWCLASGADPCYSNFHSFVMAMTDAVILSQQIVTIAEMQGLGTCYLGTVNYNAKEISDFLELPDLVIPVASLSLGFPAETGNRQERLPVDAVIHNEKYRNESLSEIIDIYRDIDGNPANQQFVKENDKLSLAQVFTDVRYPRKTNESVSESFKQLLKDKGF